MAPKRAVDCLPVPRDHTSHGDFDPWDAKLSKRLTKETPISTQRPPAMPRKISQPQLAPSTLSTRKWLSVKSLLVFCGAAIGALTVYYRILFGVSWWDDEGYLMATVQAVVQGHALYDQIYTLYGPFYYLVEWIFYASTGLAVSHDCVRLIALALWPLSAALIAWCTYRLSQSLLLTGFTFLSIIELLRFFALECGHPEEVCIVLLAFLLALVCSVSDSPSRRTAAWFGFLLSALAMTKINIGLYATLALLLTLAATLPKTRFRTIALGVTGIASILFVIAIMSQLFHLAWARNYCCEVVLSLVAFLIMAWFTGSEVPITPSWWAILAGAFVLTSIAIVVPFLLHGTTIGGLLYITVFQHKDFARHWFRASQFGEKTVAWSVFSMLLVIIWSWTSIRGTPRDSVRIGLQILKGALGLSAAYFVIGTPFDTTRMGSQTMRAVGPFVWLLLVQPISSRASKASFSRIGLGFFSILVTLYAFPVSGSQSSFAIVPMMVVAALFLHDAAVELVAVAPIIFGRRVQQFVASAALVVLAAFYLRELRDAHRDYASGVPLGLPGTRLIRVTRADAGTYQWLIGELDSRRCPSFFSMPGLFSLYFWTHQNSPTLMMMNDWPAFFGSSQQEFILNDLKRAGTSCIVYNPALVEFLRAGQDLSLSPLARYIHSNFQTVEERNGYQFMLPKNQ